MIVIDFAKSSLQMCGKGNTFFLHTQARGGACANFTIFPSIFRLKKKAYKRKEAKEN